MKVVFVTAYPLDVESLGGGGWVDRRIVAALEAAGCSVEVFPVCELAGGDHRTDVPLEVRGSRRLLGRVASRMLVSGEPYQAAKFRAFDSWTRRQEALRTVSAGAHVIASQWPSLLLASDAQVDVGAYVAHNVEAEVARQYSPAPLRAWRDASRLERLENDLTHRVARVTAISRTDAARIGPATSWLPVPLIPEATAGRGTGIGLIGKASWPPNREAIEFLLGPLTAALRDRGAVPRIVLAGSGTEEYASHETVAATGRVATLSSFYESIDLTIVHRGHDATGISVKLLEAAEWGVPAVVSQSVAEAVDADGPWHVASTPDAYAEAVLARDPRADQARVAAFTASRSIAALGPVVRERLLG
jgi:hypothetical protein